MPTNAGLILREKLKSNELFRGNITNRDTGFYIQIGAWGYNDTLTYAQRELRKSIPVVEAYRRVNVLTKIKELVENAVLLGTETVSDTTNPNRSFIHSFYTIAEVNDVIELIRIKVDELESETNPSRRFYNLKDFEILNDEPPAVNWDFNPSTDASGDSKISFTNISICDLFKLVKTYDKNFSYKPVSKYALNEDGTPKVFYHQTNGGFTTYAKTHSDQAKLITNKNPTKSKDIRYSRKPFAEQVDDVLNGDQQSYSYSDVYVCETPQILKEAGLSDLPMLMTVRHLRDINAPKDNKKNHHGVPREIIKEIPNMLENPVMIMDSLTREDSIVVIGSKVVDKEPMLIAVKVDGEGKENNIAIDSNFITSAYGKEGFIGFINKNLRNKKFIYANKKRSQDLFSVLGVQFPSVFNKLDFNVIIRKTNSKVKPLVEKNSELDKKYLSAVENGDMETAQKMVDEAAKRAGYSTKMYRGEKARVNPFYITQTLFRNLSKIFRVKMLCFCCNLQINCL